MAKRINFEVKQQIVSLSGACFWYWNSFYAFLDSCGVSKALQKQFPRESFNKYDVIRNILARLEEKNDIETINNIISSFYRLRNAVDRDNLDEDKAKSLLKEFRDLVGNDPIEQELKKQERTRHRQMTQERINETLSFNRQLGDLNNEFSSLLSLQDVTPQQRGFSLEKIFFDLLRIHEFEFTPPYKTADGEQIDGHFRYEKFDYLVEIKWTSENTKQKDLSIFDGKIKGKAQSTRGFFLSASGFDENAILKFSGDSPRIVLMNGEDLALILNGNHTLFDVIKIKVDALVRYGKINFQVREM